MKLSKSKEALYTSIATFSFGALVISSQLFARSVVKRDPTTQGYHLIGFGCVWMMGMIFLVSFTALAWSNFFYVPPEERDTHRFIRFVTFLILLFSGCILAIEASLFAFSILSSYISAR
ncbi:MAG: hypothetical protein P8016_05525 [Sedimentisphaerales bacterium]